MHDSSCIFEIIQQAQMTYGSLSVKELCQIAGVSRSGYYAWLKAAPIRERQEEQDRQDFDLILAAYKMHGYTKGAKGIYLHGAAPYGSTGRDESEEDPPVNG